MQKQTANTKQPQGLTLVEMVIALAVMAVVFTAMVPLLASVRTNWTARQANTEVVQNARILTDHLSRTLAGAVEITDVSPSSDSKGHISLVTSDGQECGYSVSDDGYVRFGLLSGEAGDLAGPVTEFRLTGYDGNDFVTPTDDPAAIRYVTVDAVFSNPSDMGQEKPLTMNVYLRPAPPTEDVSPALDPGVAIGDAIVWGGQGRDIDSYRSSQGPYDPTKPGTEAVVSVNATYPSAITVQSQTKIHGDVCVGPGGNPDRAVTLLGGAQITGTQGILGEPVGMATASVPSRRPFTGGHQGNLSLWGTNTLTLDTDRHLNKIELSGDSRLIVDGDVTLLVDNTFQMSTRAEVLILPKSSLTLYARQDVTVSGSAKLNDSTQNPSRLHIYMIGNNRTLEMSGNAMTYGVLENPNGKVSLWSGARVFGKVKAKTLEGGGRIHVDLDCGFGSDQD